MTPEEFELHCKKLEHFVTPQWAADAILKQEKLYGSFVLDPCTGRGILAEAAKSHGYNVVTNDIFEWGYPLDYKTDFINGNIKKPKKQFSVFVNPPFSLACEFVRKSFDLGAGKVLLFQRFAWLESKDRREFWQQYKPTRVYICAERATCWRHDLPEDENGNRYCKKTGKKLSNTPTAHGWFVFDWMNCRKTQLRQLYRD